MSLGELAVEEFTYLIILAALDVLIIPLEVFWLHRYYRLSNHRIDPAGKQRHRCITLRHYRITWVYLMTALFACNIAHPLSIIVYYLHRNIPTPTIICSYLLSDIATLSVLYLCLIRAFMILWDIKCNLARKEQFWKTQIRNDNLGDNSYEASRSVLCDDERSTNFWIKYRNQRHRLISLFLGIIGPLSLLITICPFIVYPSSIHSTTCQQAHGETFDAVNTHHLCPEFTTSSGLRILLTLPIVIILGVIWWKIPKFNEAMGIKYEIKSIILIVNTTFIVRDVVITGMLYICFKLIRGRSLMLINGTINMLSAFLLFFVSTGFMLPKLREIIFQHSHSTSSSSYAMHAFAVSDKPLVPSLPVTPSMLMKGIGTRLGMVKTTSRTPEATTTPTHALGDGTTFPDIAEIQRHHYTHNKLTKTMRIWRHRPDRSPQVALGKNENINADHHDDDDDDDDDDDEHCDHCHDNKRRNNLAMHLQIEHSQHSEHGHNHGVLQSAESGSPPTLQPDLHSGDGIQQNIDSGDSGDATKSGITPFHYSSKHETPDPDHEHHEHHQFDHELLSTSQTQHSHMHLDPLSQQRSSESTLSTQPQAIVATSSTGTITHSPSRGAFHASILNPSASNSRKHSLSRTRKSQSITRSGKSVIHQIHHHEFDMTRVNEREEPDPLDEDDEEFPDDDTTELGTHYSHDDTEYVMNNINLGLNYPTDTATKTSSGISTPQMSITKSPGRPSTSHNYSTNISRVSHTTHSRHSSMGAMSKFNHSSFNHSHHSQLKIDHDVFPSDSLRIFSQRSSSVTTGHHHFDHFKMAMDSTSTAHLKPRGSIDPSSASGTTSTATATATTTTASGSNTNTTTNNTVTSSGSDKPLKSEHRRKSSFLAGIKHMRSSISNLFGNDEEEKDGEMKEYYDITLDDPLNVVLSDPDGLSHLADHLCAEFSIENLLFIIEALQYRYRIPQSLFEEEDPLGQSHENDKCSKSESCELLMHVIHQNKKLPISKALQSHTEECKRCRLQSTLHHPSSLDSDPMDLDHHHTDDAVSGSTLSATNSIFKRLHSTTKSPVQCCKSCVVYKFQYIVAKYVQTPSDCLVNLSHSVQSKLKHIYNQLLIEDPQKRFIKMTTTHRQNKGIPGLPKTSILSKDSKDSRDSKSSPIMAIPNRIKLKLSRKHSGSKGKGGGHSNRVNDDKKKNENGGDAHCGTLDDDRKSGSFLEDSNEQNHGVTQPRISLENIKKVILSRNKRERNEAEEILSEEIISEEQLDPVQPEPDPDPATVTETASADTEEQEEVTTNTAGNDVDVVHDHPMAARRQVTESNLSLNDSRHFWNHNDNHSADHSNQSHQSHHTKDLVPSTTASPRMVSNLQNSLTEKGLHIRVLIADHPSTSRDTPICMTPENNTPITKATTTTSSSGVTVSGHSRSTDNDVGHDKTPSLKPQKVNEHDIHHHSNHEHRLSPEMTEHKEQESSSRVSGSADIVEITEIDPSPNVTVTLPPTMNLGDSVDESAHKEDEIEEMMDSEEVIPKDMRAKPPVVVVQSVTADDIDDDECHNEAVIGSHDGFGDINYFRVFDDAVLELIRLIKADTWCRFKQSEQFKNWANDFRAS